MITDDDVVRWDGGRTGDVIMSGSSCLGGGVCCGGREEQYHIPTYSPPGLVPVPVSCVLTTYVCCGGSVVNTMDTAFDRLPNNNTASSLQYLCDAIIAQRPCAHL